MRTPRAQHQVAEIPLGMLHGRQLPALIGVGRGRHQPHVALTDADGVAAGEDLAQVTGKRHVMTRFLLLDDRVHRPTES